MKTGELIFNPFHLINWFFQFCESLQNFYHVTGTMQGDSKYERLLTLRNLWTSEDDGLEVDDCNVRK